MDLTGGGRPRPAGADPPASEVPGGGGSAGAASALAELVAARVPGVEAVRWLASGAAALGAAVALARAATGRALVLEFEGCERGRDPASLRVPFNDLDGVQRAFAGHRGAIAAVVVQPVATDLGAIPAEPGFLEGLRAHCDVSDALLVHDERVSGFRVAPAGLHGPHPARCDLVVLGGIPGAGRPLGAVGGPRGLVERAPAGAGPDPRAVAASLAALRALGGETAHGALERAGRRLATGLMGAAHRSGRVIAVGRRGPVLCPYFAPVMPRDLDGVRGTDLRAWARFVRGMARRGVRLPRSPRAPYLLSLDHDDTVVERVIAAAEATFDGG